MPRMRWLVAVLLLWTCVVSAGCQLPEPYRIFLSPDGRYRVEVWRFPQDFAMPGQAGDAPGAARLVEITTGKLLAEAPLDMVQLAGEVHWSNGHASIKLIVDWVLATFRR
jgi:hypothetical protein